MLSIAGWLSYHQYTYYLPSIVDRMKHGKYREERDGSGSESVASQWSGQPRFGSLRGLSSRDLNVVCSSLCFFSPLDPLLRRLTLFSPGSVRIRTRRGEDSFVVCCCRLRSNLSHMEKVSKISTNNKGGGQRIL